VNLKRNNRVGSCGLNSSGSGEGPVASSVQMAMNLQVPLWQGISLAE